MQRIGELFDLSAGYAQSFQDLELVCVTGGLCNQLSLLGFCFVSRITLGFGNGSVRLFLCFFGHRLLVPFEIGTEKFHFANELVSRGLQWESDYMSDIRHGITNPDGHPGDVETMGKEGAFTKEPLITSRELDLGDGESMTKMQRSIHVGKWEASEPLWVPFVDLGGGQTRNLLP
jgi:hypothetical protein